MPIKLLTYKINFIRVLLIIFACVFTGNAYSRPVPKGTYSTISYSKQSGDINGVELLITPTQDKLFGIFIFAEGVPDRPCMTEFIDDGKLYKFELTEPCVITGKGYLMVKQRAVLLKLPGGAFADGKKEGLSLPKKRGFWD
jgi:hypothetical protein